MKKTIFLFTSFILLFIVACEKKEKLYKLPPVPAGIQTRIFSLGDNYENQIWFNIKDQQSWVNRHDAWEIAFASGAGNEIIINGGKNNSIGVAKLSENTFNTFSKIKLSAITPYDFDNPSGEADSQVFNNWADKISAGQFQGKKVLYIIDRGEDSMGNRRWVQLRLHGRAGGVYHFSWNYALDTSAMHDVFINPDVNYNFAYYNFGTAKEVVNEPITKDKWDIVFSTYKKYIPDPANGNKPYPYILRGVLSNRNGVQVYDVPNVGLNTWEQINLDYAKGVVFSTHIDEIGYDWKIWNMTANKYTMANKIYVVKDVNDDYYKMKFVDFYDDNGKKGYPKMAWELLK